MEQSDNGYNDTHRAFLQTFLGRQVLTFDEARPLLASIQSAQNPERPVLEMDISFEEFEQYVEALNAALSPLDMEIRNQRHQETKEQIYALVNVSSDALTQMATIHTADEIGFLKRVLDAMFITNNTIREEVMAISGMQAMRLSKAPRIEVESQSKAQDLTQSQAEQMLANLVAEGWFERSRHGFFSLSPRALMELRGWLLDTYNEREDDQDNEEGYSQAHERIKICLACKNIVTVGQRCPVPECNGRLHNHCKRHMFGAQGGREECPVCRTAWQDPMPVGEKAVRNNRRSTNGVHGNKRRNTKNGPRPSHVDSEDDSD